MASDIDSKGGPNPPKAVPETPRKKRRVLKALVVVLLLLAALVAAAPTLIGAFARARIASVAAAALEADVSIGDLSLGWLSGVAVSDIDVTPHAPGKPGMRVGSITAKPTLAALLTGRVEVPDLVVKHVTLNLAKGAHEEEDEDEDALDREEASKPQVSIPDFGLGARIEDVTIVYTAPGWPHPIRVEHVGPVTIKATNRDATRVEIVAGPSVKASIDLLWAKDGKKLRRKERSIQGEVTFDHADLKYFEGAAAPWLAALRGIADGAIRFNSTGKSVTSTGTLRLSDAAVAMIGASEDHVLQDLVLKHDVTRDAAGTAWTGGVEVAAAKGRIAPVSNLGRPLAIEKLDMKARLSSNIRVDVDRVSLVADFGGFDGSGSVTAGKEPFGATADLDARAALAQIAPWVGGLPDITGTLASKVKVVLAPDGLVTVRGTTAINDFVAQGVSGVGTLREKQITFRHDLDYGAGALKMHDVALSSSFATATCSGALTPKADGAPPEGKVAVRIGADLDVIAGLLGENLAVRPKGKVSLTGNIAGAASGTAFDVTLGGSGVALSGGPFAAGPLDLGEVTGLAKGTLSADRTHLMLPEWRLRASILEASGRVDVRGLRDRHPQVVASLTASAQPDKVLAAMSTTPQTRKIGSVQLVAEVTGTDAAWVASATKLSAAGVSGVASVTYPHADVPAGAPTFEAVLTGALEKVLPLVAQDVVASGSFRANLKGAFGEQPTLDATVQGENLRVQASPGGAVVSGNALVTAKAEATGAFDARLISPSLTFTDPTQKSVSGEVAASATGRYDADKKVIDVTSLTASGPGTTATGTARIEVGKAATFDLKSDLVMAEAAPLLAFFAPSLQASGTGTLRANGRMNLAEAGMRDSHADLKIRLDGLRTEALDLRNVDLDAVLEGGVAKTRKATATLNGGSAMLDATWDFRPEVPAWSGVARIDGVEITKEMQPAIARAIPIFAGVAVTVKGRANANLDLSGRGSNWDAIKPTLSGTGVIGARGAQVSQSEMLEVIGQFIGVPRNVAFQDFESRFQVQDGAVRQERLLLSSDQLDLKMSGTTSFEGRLNYDVGVKPKGRIGNEWSRFRSVLDREGFLGMRLAGDIAKPSLKPPKIENVIGGAVEDALKGGLDDLLKRKKKKKEEN